MLEIFRLNPVFMPMPNPAMRCIESDAGNGRIDFIDIAPIYPGHPDAVRFFGNFTDVACAFTVDTDDAETIRALMAAVDDNLMRGKP
jgi:hypothetical protein